VTAASDVYAQDEALQTCIFRVSLLSVSAQASNVALSATSFDTGLHGGLSRGYLTINRAINSCIYSSISCGATPQLRPLQFGAYGSTEPRTEAEPRVLGLAASTVSTVPMQPHEVCVVGLNRQRHVVGVVQAQLLEALQRLLEQHSRRRHVVALPFDEFLELADVHLQCVLSGG
jgi:hypothetical protein